MLRAKQVEAKKLDKTLVDLQKDNNKICQIFPVPISMNSKEDKDKNTDITNNLI